ncbi:hypothetical protein TSUD_300920 [Trifolium subterraneum]|uniref:Uncharacterized protein n=1 Tax=Trifolium subterraneum TaxID=3900 RepID=A0A2Z6P504_TRISU|nr:hypothetical protein TSUD_300920 [Trifolium subterraneum]
MILSFPSLSERGSPVKAEAAGSSPVSPDRSASGHGEGAGEACDVLRWIHNGNDVEIAHKIFRRKW